MKNAFIHTLLAARDYQDRPEFEQLCDWWREGGVGVCALVGIGGAGKTALAERFLRVLPGGLPAPKGVQKRTELPQPEAVFVFSFYQVPNPDSFFAQVHAWLHDEVYSESGPLPSYESVIQELHGAGSRVLLVLDGLEKAQDDGMRGGPFGQILDGRLRDLVVRAADGWLPGVSLLITTRFQLWDLKTGRCQCCRDISVEQLEAKTAVALLRKRGVRGTDLQLEALARDQGFHALTVDLMGGYVAKFCGGDISKLKRVDEPPHVPEDESNLDPQVAALREQERRFARVAARYAESFRESDPAALALLQRVCLFRLGVDPDTLGSIFLGKEKKGISGPHLAGLTSKQLQAKLELLAGMRLLDVQMTGSGAHQKKVYSLHPAVRNGFALDAEVAAGSHEAIRESLNAGLLFDGENPSDPGVLDLLEEIIYHTLSAGQAQEAFEMYWSRMGSYSNLGHRLGTYERGERICRAFARGASPQATALPKGLSVTAHAAFLNQWGLYLSDLGRLNAAACGYARVIQIVMRQKDWANASRGNQNVAWMTTLAGYLRRGLVAAKQAVRLADRADRADHRAFSYSFRADARAVRGNAKAALEDFSHALHWQHQREGDDGPLYSLAGIGHTRLLARLGHLDEAARLTERNIQILDEGWGPHNFHDPQCRLVLADIACLRGDLPESRRFLSTAHDWAIAHDDKQVLCWTALVRARIERDAGNLDATRDGLDNGLRVARECGYGIYHIDLLLVQAELELLLGDPGGAEQVLRTALFDGIHPLEESGYPVLLAATDDECGYAWGISEGRYVLAQTYLLRAAQMLGKDAFVPARCAQLPAEVQSLINQAESEIKEAGKLCRKMRPDKDSEIPLEPKLRQLREELKGGVLTKYPLEKPKEPEKEEPTMPASPKRFHVALSFPGEYRDVVAQVADALAARIGRDQVFYDKYYEAELGRPDLDTYLQGIYHDESELIVPFLCAEYEAKEWCGLEWRAVRDLLKKKQAPAIMPFRFDSTHIPGLFSIDGYIDATNRPPQEIADLILQRLELNRR